MRWPHPCFLLLRGINNSYRRAPSSHQRVRIPFSGLQLHQGGAQSSSISSSSTGHHTRLFATKSSGSGASSNGSKSSTVNNQFIDKVVATNVPSNPLSFASIQQQQKASVQGLTNSIMAEAEGSDQEQDQQAMDISIPGSDLQMGGNTTTTDNGTSAAAAAKNNGTQLPLNSVMEESNSTSETDGVPAPLLHEHHKTLSSKSTTGTDDSEDNDVAMSATWQKALLQRPSLAAMGPCKSIDEASVNTTIESVTMGEANKLEAKMEAEITERETSSAAELEGQEKLNEIMPSASSDTAYYTAREGSDLLVTTDTFETAEGDTSGTPSNSTAAQRPRSPSANHNVKLRLTPEEERLFNLLADAAEAYEAGKLTIDPNPPQQSVSARGGFTKQESNATGDEASWLKPPPKVDRIEIRVAGGWVRDKLLNQHSCDVDVALDCMMGVQFARIVQSYLALLDSQKAKDNGVIETEQPEEEESKKQLPQSKQGGKAGKQAKKKKDKSKQPKIGVIGANPSQSKHLETATMNIHGIDVDFVNLRAEEVYELDSRIPTSDTRMFGTPLEDALRRDFTINSLFYNIRTKRVEDWTSRGLDDLMIHRRIVTPVNANETFHDDPLRVLRAIRFCVRLDFTLDDQIKEAAMSKRVHHSLHVKVSRERVGKELEGMLTGKHARPARALVMIGDLHLAGSVFAFPGSFPGDHDYAGGPVVGNILGVKYNCSVGTDCPEKIEQAAGQRARGWDESSKLLGVLPMVMEGHVDERDKVLREKSGKGEEAVADANALTPVNMRLLHLCIFILPFHNLTFPDKKGREVAVTAQMVKEALKFPVRDIRAVSDVLSHVDEMAEILSEIRGQLEEAAQQSGAQEEDGSCIRLTPPCRLRAGLLLRSLKENWVTCLLTAAAWEIRLYQRRCFEGEAEADDGTATQTMLISAEQPSREFYHAIVDDLDLDECWSVRPHLNGKEMIKELSLPKGPLVGVYIEDQTRWMLLNPKGTREECMTHLHQCKREREEEQMAIDDQNEANVGVANGDGQSSPILEGQNNGDKHFSKKIRADD